ncbi:MAG: protein mobD [Nitrospirae bacterium]|jgi:MinD-like ATPase involved in chromosome partitioning or flagellar assembly|nr:protein mobD [Nitrospirota bacterium]
MSIYLVNGAKGGVGKSMITMALLDYLKDRDPALLETDTANPDVGMAYKQEVSRFDALDLGGEDAWIDFANFIAESDGPVVVNSAAGTDASDSTARLKDALQELDRSLTVFWVINTQRDSLELLKKFWKEMGGQEEEKVRIHVCRNLFFGEADDFRLYNDSGIRKEVEAAGGKTLDFPKVAKRVSHSLYVDRLSIVRALEKMPFGNRIELQRWRKLVHSMFLRAEV